MKGIPKDPWEVTEGLAATTLRRRGVKCKQTGKHRAGYDIITAHGVRCEVKFARYRAKQKFWKVNIHRWKKMTEGECDFYVIALATRRKLAWTRLYLVVPSPVKRKVLTFTWRTLLRKWHSSIDAWHLIEASERKAA